MVPTQFAASRANAPKVLCLGYDAGLLAERTAALRDAGYDVHATNELQQALIELRQHEFDAVVAGHLVPESDREQLVREVRKHRTRLKIVLLYWDSIRNAECADAVNWIGSGPVALVQTLHGLLGHEGTG